MEDSYFPNSELPVIITRLIKTVWDWYKNRHTDQWNKTEGPRIIPHTNVQLIFDKGTNNIQWGKNRFRHTTLGQTDLHMQKTPAARHTQKQTQSGSQIYA